MVVVGRFGRVHVAVQRRHHRVEGHGVAVLLTVMEEHVQGIGRGHGLRKHARGYAGDGDLAENRPHDPKDYASDVVVRQSRAGTVRTVPIGARAPRKAWPSRTEPPHPSPRIESPTEDSP